MDRAAGRMTDQLRHSVHSMQRAHWRLMLDQRRQGRWTGRRLLEHHRRYVEGARSLLVSNGAHWVIGGPLTVADWFRKWT